MSKIPNYKETAAKWIKELESEDRYVRINAMKKVSIAQMTLFDTLSIERKAKIMDNECNACKQGLLLLIQLLDEQVEE